MLSAMELCIILAAGCYLAQTAAILYDKFNNRKLQNQLVAIVMPMLQQYLQQQYGVPIPMPTQHGPSTTGPIVGADGVEHIGMIHHMLHDDGSDEE